MAFIKDVRVFDPSFNTFARASDSAIIRAAQSVFRTDDNVTYAILKPALTEINAPTKFYQTVLFEDETTFAADSTFEQDVHISGTTSCPTVNISDTLSAFTVVCDTLLATDTLTVGGEAVVGALSTAGPITSAELYNNGTFQSNGITSLNQTIIAGTLTCSSGITGTALSLSGNLSVLGTTAVRALTATLPATFGDSVFCSSILAVSGATTLATTTASSLTVTGASTLNSATLSGSLAVSGTTTLASAAVTNGGTFGGSVEIGTPESQSQVLLNLNSTTKGLLIPRLTSTQRNAISSPPAGLVVYDTDLSQWYIYHRSAWDEMRTGSDRNYINLKLSDTVGIVSGPMTIKFDIIEGGISGTGYPMSYNTTTGALTVTVSGLYMVHASCSFYLVGTAERMVRLDFRDDLGTVLAEAVDQIASTGESPTDYGNAAIGRMCYLYSTRTYYFKVSSSNTGDARLEWATHATIFKY
jgi:hypothetical protein